MPYGVEDIDGIVFDLGNVIVRIDFDRVFAHWASSAGLEVDHVKSRFAFDMPYRRHERNEIETREYFASLRKTLGVDIDDDALLKGWGEVFVEEIEPTVALLPRLAARVPLYVFSNTNRTHHQQFSQRFAHALEPFTKVYVSHELGHRKPDPEAYLAVARDIGTPAQRLLFLDDLQENIDGAREAGMHAALIREPLDVRHAVAPWLGSFE